MNIIYKWPISSPWMDLYHVFTSWIHRVDQLGHQSVPGPACDVFVGPMISSGKHLVYLWLIYGQSMVNG